MELIEKFLKYMEVELNLSPNTLAAYRRDLKAWRDYATGGSGRDFQPMDMTTGDLRRWLAFERRRGCSVATLRRKTQSLRAFFRYLMRHHGLACNPALDIVNAKLPKPLPAVVKTAETGAMLDAEVDSGDFRQVRDALVLEVLYDCGLRCQELIDLQDAAVDTRGMSMRVMGKRRKERIVPFGPVLARRIDDYRESRATVTGVPATDTFFVRPDGQPLYRKLVYNIVHDAMTAAGVHATRLSPHVLRHSCATDMLNAGADLDAVRQMLGHASLATTQIYTHLTYRDLQYNYQHAHPRALKK